MKIEDKYENLKQEFKKKMDKIQDLPEESINDISKIIYNDFMDMAKKTLETWINDKAGTEYNKKKQ